MYFYYTWSFSVVRILLALAYIMITTITYDTVDAQDIYYSLYNKYNQNYNITYLIPNILSL